MRRCSASRSGVEHRIFSRQASGSCTSRSSNVTLKSPVSDDLLVHVVALGDEVAQAREPIELVARTSALPTAWPFTT